MCMCVNAVCVEGERGVVSGCESFPVELIIPILTYEAGGGQEAGEGLLVVGRCGCEQRAN